MNLGDRKQASLMACLALNEIEGFSASQLYPVIRSYADSSLTYLLHVLKAASNGQCNNYAHLTNICIAVNGISPRPDLHTLCVYMTSISCLKGNVSLTSEMAQVPIGLTAS
jgi:hypothetical protein